MTTLPIPLCKKKTNFLVCPPKPIRRAGITAEEKQTQNHTWCDLNPGLCREGKAVQGVRTQEEFWKALLQMRSS